MKLLKVVSIIWLLIVITVSTAVFIALQVPKQQKIINKAEQEYDLVVITKETSPKILFINELIYQTDTKYISTFYYDNEWTKFKQKDVTIEINQNTLSTTKTTIDTRANIQTEKMKISIDAKNTPLNMAIRSQENYHKTGGIVNGTIKINDVTYDCNIAILAGFNYAPKDLDLTALGIMTKWRIFFDKDGNFYHTDITQVKNPTKDYNAHKFVSKISSEGKIVEYLTEDIGNLTTLGNNFNYWEVDTRAKGFAVTDSAGGFGIELNLNTGF